MKRNAPLNCSHRFFKVYSHTLPIYRWTWRSIQERMKGARCGIPSYHYL